MDLTDMIGQNLDRSGVQLVETRSIWTPEVSCLCLSIHVSVQSVYITGAMFTMILLSGHQLPNTQQALRKPFNGSPA